MSESEYEDTDFRDYRVPEEKREFYKELTEDEMSPVHGADMKEIFVFSFAYGCKKAGRVPFEANSHLFNRNTLDEGTEWIMRSVAVDEVGTTDILIDRQKIRDIVEEYASGGVTELHNKVFAPGEDGLIELSDNLMNMSDLTD